MGHKAVPIKTSRGIRWVAPKQTTVRRKTISRGGGGGRVQYQVLYKTSYDVASKRYVTRRVEVPQSQFNAKAQAGYSVSKAQSQLIAETVQQKAEQAQLQARASAKRAEARTATKRQGLSESAKRLVMVQEFKGATDSKGEGWRRSKGFSEKLEGIKRESTKTLMKETAPIEFTAKVPYKYPSQAPIYARQSGGMRFGGKDYDVDFTYKKPPKGKEKLQLKAGATIYPDFMKGYKKPSIIDKLKNVKVPYTSIRTGYAAPSSISSRQKRGGISRLFTAASRKGTQASFQMFGTTNPIRDYKKAYSYAQEGIAGGTTKLLIPQKLIGTMEKAEKQPFRESKGLIFDIGRTTYKFKEPRKRQKKIWERQSGIISASKLTLKTVRDKPVDVAVDYALWKGAGAATSYGLGALKYATKTKIGLKATSMFPKAYRRGAGIVGRTGLYGGMAGGVAYDIAKQPTRGDKIFRAEELALQAYAFGKGFKYQDRFAFQRAAKAKPKGTFKFEETPSIMTSRKPFKTVDELIKSVKTETVPGLKIKGIQAAGAFKPKTGILKLREGLSGMERQLTTVHELTHYKDPFIQRAIKTKGSVKYPKGFSSQIKKDWIKLDPMITKPMPKGTSKFLIDPYYKFKFLKEIPKPQRTSELLASFAESHTGQIIKPTTKTGKFLKGIAGFKSTTIIKAPPQRTLYGKPIATKQVKRLNLEVRKGVQFDMGGVRGEVNPLKKIIIMYQPKSQAALSQFGRSGLKRTDKIFQIDQITRAVTPVHVRKQQPFIWREKAKAWSLYNPQMGKLYTQSKIAGQFKIARAFSFPKITVKPGKQSVLLDSNKGGFRTIKFPKYKKGGQRKKVAPPSKGTLPYEMPPSHTTKGKLDSFNTPRYIDAVKKGQKQYSLINYGDYGRTKPNILLYDTKPTPLGKIRTKTKIAVFPSLKPPPTKVRTSTTIFGVQKDFVPDMKIKSARIMTKQLPDIMQDTIPELKVIPSLQLRQSTRQTPDLQLRQDIITSKPNLLPIIEPPTGGGFGFDFGDPTPPPPIIPDFDFDLGRGMRGVSKKGKKRTKSYGIYSPSLVAIDFNIKTFKEPKFTSGIGIRPIARRGL